MPVTIEPLNQHLGVMVTGVSGAELTSPEVARQCQDLVDRHGVVVYRGAHIDDDQLIDLGRHLGELVSQPTGDHARPEIQAITLDTAKTSALMASYRKGNFLWHYDGSMDAAPQKGTFLSAIEVDDAGEGGTQFASTYVAWDTLPADEQRAIEGLQVEFSFAAAHGRANPDATDAERADWDRVPTRVHPLVWSRQDGRKSLLLGATAHRVLGWTQEASDELLGRLLDWATQPDRVLTHHWQRGDLVTWDNTGMLHRAAAFKATSRRLLHRITLVGQEAVQPVTAA